MTTTTTNNLLSISRINSTNTTSFINQITTTTYTSFMFDPDDKPLVGKTSPVTLPRLSATRSTFSKLIHSFFTIISIPTTFRCPSLTPSLGRKVTGTLFGNRRGQVSFAVQYDPRSVPILIIELAVSTSALVKEMSSGLVRIALECEKKLVEGNGKLLKEPVWTMYCNGRKCGYAETKSCSESDWRVLSMVQSVSVGAGVIPVVEDGRKNKVGASEGELVYMRARFERVVGSRDSEAYYMMNPDRNGGPELSIFMLRM